MTKSLLTENWVMRLAQLDRLIIGFSGGLDSTVLLHLLASESQLKLKLMAVHINHGLSPHADAWQQHCARQCLQLGINFVAQTVNFDRSANIEEGARNARYNLFSSMLRHNEAVIVGHHLDDQAETLLLQLFRGTGIDGLAAMSASNTLGLGSIIRPLLTHSREHLQTYAERNQLEWIEDESNQCIHYSRNYLRQEVMPLLIKQWPGVTTTIARTATHCQQAKLNLDALAQMDCPELNKTTNRLFIEPLRHFTVERISNVLRVWLKNNQAKLPPTSTFQRLIQEVLYASPDAMPLVSWSKVQIRRYRNYLYLETKTAFDLPSSIEWLDFPNSLIVADGKMSLSASKSKKGLNLACGAKIHIRFRQGGEVLCWHGQTKLLKKLMQDFGIPPWLRDRIPLLYVNEQLAAVVGYAISDLFYTESETTAYEIQALTLG